MRTGAAVERIFLGLAATVMTAAGPPSDLEDTAVALSGRTADSAPNVGASAPALVLFTIEEREPVNIDFPPQDQRPTILASAVTREWAFELRSVT